MTLVRKRKPQRPSWKKHIPLSRLLSSALGRLDALVNCANASASPCAATFSNDRIIYRVQRAQFFRPLRETVVPPSNLRPCRVFRLCTARLHCEITPCLVQREWADGDVENLVVWPVCRICVSTCGFLSLGCLVCVERAGRLRRVPEGMHRLGLTIATTVDVIYISC